MKYLKSKKIFENLNAAKNFLDKNKIDQDNPDFLKIKELLSKNTGYIFAFTKFFYNGKKTLGELSYLYRLMLSIKNNIGQLPKQIDTYSSYEELIDDIMNIEEIIKFNKVINELPAIIKKQAKENKDYFRIITTMEDNIYDDYIELFLKKMSKYNYTNMDDLINLTNAHIESYISKEEVLAKINKVKDANIVFNDKNVIVAWIKTEEASIKLGSVSWCIVSRGMWNTYNKPELLNKQYFVWNFNVKPSDNDFMLGTTIYPDGGEKATHLKDDSSTSLSKYCKTYNLDENIFKPLQDNEVREYLKTNMVKVNGKILDILIKKHLWKEFIDEIPLSIRSIRGLVLPEDVDNLTHIQRLIYDNKFDEIIKFLDNDGEFEHIWERYLLVNSYEFEESYIKKILDPVIEDSYEWRYDDGIIYIEMDDIDDFYKTFDCEEYIARMIYTVGVGVYGGGFDDFFDTWSERDYFDSYLEGDDNIERFKEILQRIGIYEDDYNDRDGELYTRIKELGIGLEYTINDFIDELNNKAENIGDSLLRKDKDNILFDYEQGYRSEKSELIMPIENILKYLSENERISGTIESILDNEPNETYHISGDNTYMSSLLYGQDLTEETTDFINKFEERLEENEDLLKEYDEFNKLVKGLGFTKTRNGEFTMSNQNYKFKIKKYDEGNISGSISLIDKNDYKDFSIPLEDFDNFVNNLKLDFYFERIKRFEDFKKWWIQ